MFVHNSIWFRKATASPSNERTDKKKKEKQKKLVRIRIEENTRSKKKQTNDGYIYNEPTRKTFKGDDAQC